MDDRARGHTTVRADVTASARQDAHEWGIRWLFPRRSPSFTRLTEETMLLGRDEDCPIRLEGDQISRKHAEIGRQGLVGRVRDLDSKNGVYVNGVRVTEAVIGPGSLLRFGEWIGLLHVGVPQDENGFGQISSDYWGSETLQRALEPARRAATSELPLIIQGETGTGKEGAARAIHTWSGRKGAFLAVNCSALPEALAEGQLFGYRKGAFTGADRPNEGYFRAADGGTLFLDEIADLPLLLQPKLLRALEQKEVHPLGEPRPLLVDVRIVAAAQQPLGELVAEKRMRADLHARLEGLVVELPPLRDRREDVPPLFRSLLERYARPSGKAAPETETKLVEQLCLHDWPYNIRELDLLARRLVALHGGEAILRRAHLPASILASSGSRRRSTQPAAPVSTAAAAPVTAELLAQALREHNGVVARAAAALGISRQKAYRLMAHRNDGAPEGEDDPATDVD